MKRGAYRAHITSPDDLITTHEATRAGFVSLALERNRRATPFVKHARVIKLIASKASSPHDLWGFKELHDPLLAAAGVSEKAASHLSEGDKKKAVNGLIEDFLLPAGEAFVEEFIYRFLLTKGDALGGLMRNIGGILAQRDLCQVIVSLLKLHRSKISVLTGENKEWRKMNEFDEAELSHRGLSWQHGKSKRTLLFNIKVPLVGKNVDVCLLNASHEQAPSAIKIPQSYFALGELKGGIDPAGADEHWKTARTALNRIHEKFPQAGHYPPVFYVGAAIAERMAQELWALLEGDVLSNAANLTKEKQVLAFCEWLLSI